MDTEPALDGQRMRQGRRETGHSVTDRDLVRAHLAGEPWAFQEIVRRHTPSMAGLARRRLGLWSDDIDDAVQDAFERALKGLGRVGGSDDFQLGPWLNRIATNVCIDRQTRRLSEDRLSERLAGRPVDTAPATDEVVGDHVVRGHLSKAINELPASQRQALLLHDVGGMDYRDLAVHAGVTTDNARARVHRARRQLHTRLVAMIGLASALGTGVAAWQLRARAAAGRAALRVMYPSGSRPSSTASMATVSVVGNGPSTVGVVARGGAVLLTVASGIASVSVLAQSGPAQSGARPAATGPGSSTVQVSSAGSNGTAGILGGMDGAKSAAANVSAAAARAQAARQITAGQGTGGTHPSRVSAGPILPTTGLTRVPSTSTTTPAPSTTVTTTAPAPPSGGAPDPAWVSVARTAPTPPGGGTEPLASRCAGMTGVGGASSSSLPAGTSGPVSQTLSVGQSQRTPNSDVQVFAADAQLIPANGGTGPYGQTTADVCNNPNSQVIAANINFPGGGEAQLHGALVATTASQGATGGIYRGTVTASGPAIIPGGLPPYFAAQVYCWDGGATCQLTFAFYGPTHPSSSGSTTTTVASSGSTTTTKPSS